MKRKTLIALIPFFLISAVSVAQAGEPEELQPGVARVSLVHGDVNMQRGDSGDWVAASINTPVVAGDHVSTGARSRTEVQLDYANILRLADNSEVKIADLTRTHIQPQLRLGLMDFTVFKGSEADVEIDTPNVAIRPLKEGQYRIEVRSEGDTSVIVRQGEAEVTTPQGSTTVRKGEMIAIRGRDNPEYQVASGPRKDDWDNWNKERDHQIWDAQSWRRTNRYYTGAGDLDAYGHWVYVPGYDQVWEPVVVAGWAPYRYGRWVWEPYWGWTWVSYEPWGWAPYHYGRWFLHGARWVWWPGPAYGGFRPVWAPAYVSFFGFGRHVGVSVGFGFGSIGWLPIGPSDRFFPWWGRHGRTVNLINVTNITNIRNFNYGHGVAPLAGGTRPMMSNFHGMLDNPHLQRSVTAMPSGQFGSAPVPRSREFVSRAELREGQVMAGTVPVVPTRASLRTVDRQAGPLPPHANQPERFFTRSQPRFQPQPFHAEAARVQEALGERAADTRPAREGATPALRHEMSDNPAARAAVGPRASINNPQVRPEDRSSGLRADTRAQEVPAEHGWRRFGENRAALGGQSQAQSAPREQGQMPARTSAREQTQAAPRTDAQPAPSSSGWRRFSDRERPRAPQSAPRPSAPETNMRATPARPQTSSETPAQRPGWQRFERQPQPRTAQPETRRGGYESPAANRTFTPSRPPAAERAQAQREAPRSVQRPPLRMDRPIVTPRAAAARQSAPRGRSGGDKHGSSRPAPRSRDR
jgi:hypothetical protein